jgi:hypothetical protein
MREDWDIDAKQIPTALTGRRKTMQLCVTFGLRTDVASYEVRDRGWTWVWSGSRTSAQF